MFLRFIYSMSDTCWKQIPLPNPNPEDFSGWGQVYTELESQEFFVPA